MEGKKKFKCNNCGAIFEEGTTECPNCGRKIKYATPPTQNVASAPANPTPVAPQPAQKVASAPVMPTTNNVQVNENLGYVKVEDPSSNEEKTGEAILLTIFIGVFSFLYALARYPEGSRARISFCETVKKTLFVLIGIFVLLFIILLIAGVF